MAGAGRYPESAQLAINFPHSMPVGWFAVMPSDGLASGEVRALRAFDQELVGWRGKSGAAFMGPAYCPHLGAHLGHGGSVVGDHIRCPFHGWRFDGRGNCREIPYAASAGRGSAPRSAGDRADDGPPAHPTARLEIWPTVERNGFLWTWYDPLGRSPFYEIPELDEMTGGAWREVHRRTWRVSTQIQEMAENGVDGAHFQTVHGSVDVPESEITVDGTSRTAIQRAPLVTRRGPTTSVITVRNVGLGFSFTRFTGIVRTTSLNFVVPIDPHTIELTVVFLQPNEVLDQPEGSETRATRAIIADLEKQIGEDIPIWENKIYRARPALCDGDGPIAEYRNWCKQFYVDPTA